MVSARSLRLALVFVASPVGLLRGQSFPPSLTPDEAGEVRRAIDALRRDPRGPYERLRWFCLDGTVHPPAGTPCAERGGGVQHAELSPVGRRLAELAFHVGTILQATDPDTLVDARHGYYRLRELVLAHYLFEIDDGWVLQRAQYYRGARQIEDEEARGKALLERLLADPTWTAGHFLLATQLVRVVPHAAPGRGQTIDRIRNLATEIASLDSAFTRIRIKIHSFPSRSDLDAVASYLAAKRHPPDVAERLATLRDALATQYDPGAPAQTLSWFREPLERQLGGELAALQGDHEAGARASAWQRTTRLSAVIRDVASGSRDGRTNLMLMDLNQVLQEQAFVLAQDLERELAQPTARAVRILQLRGHFALGYGGGFLSGRERAALDAEADRLAGTERLAAGAYHDGLSYLARSLDWAYATARGVFGPVHQRYLQVEPKTAGFLDALVRGSPLLRLSHQLDRLTADADAVLGTSHVVLGQQVTLGVRGLNPGVSYRPLEVLPPEATGAKVAADRIYVLPSTTPELQPVAGVLTLDEGNLLSHVQLLARNLGIPNATVSSSLLPALRAAQGDTVFYAVSPLGRVFLERSAELTPEQWQLVAQGNRSRTEKYRLDTSRLRLDRTEPIPLRRLRARDSGVLVGPKAANLGELAAFFPDNVSAGVALPFGLFVEHVGRRFDGEGTVLQELEAAYARATEMQTAGRGEDEINAYMFAELARVRRAIMELDWLPGTRRSIVRAIEAAFGSELEDGVFIRSDTNVEDLPQFSGAGLNLTVPHRRTLDDVLAAIKRVWTSPFTERAYLWRKQILEDLGRIYPSVLLLESIRSAKSGVLISSGLQFGTPRDVTIATAEGVGGAVEGEDAETIVVSPSGAIRLLSQAKSPVRRALVDSGPGGVTMVVAQQPDQLLREREIRQLLDVVETWKRRYAGGNPRQVWDIEFGFAAGKLWLFQIRPFIGFRSNELLDRLQVLDADLRANQARLVSLSERI